MPNIVWMQAGACSGESMALLCADRPSLENLLQQYDLKLLWHPSLTADASFGQVLEAITSGREKLDILCIEGSLMTGPDGSGQYDTWKGRAKIDIIREIAPLATHVVAMGTCAAFGGVHAAGPNPTDCTGLQFLKGEPGGLLGTDWRARSGQLTEAQRHAHTIKGISRNLGMEILGDLSATVESELKDVEPCNLPPNLEALLSELHQITESLKVLD